MCWVENRALNPMHQNTVSLFLEGRKRGWDISQSENEEKRHLQLHQKFRKPGCHYTNVILQKLCLLSQMETETLSNSFLGPRLSSENKIKFLSGLGTGLLALPYLDFSITRVQAWSQLH